VLREGIIDASPGPDARYETREAIELAFITALQALPPRQRAALVLRDVLGFRTAEVAEMLRSSEDSVEGALKRARATLEQLIRWRSGRRNRLVPTRANTQPTFGCYRNDAHAPIARATGLIVLTLGGEQIAAITQFLDSSVLPRFGLPRTLRG
jgi:hypothetical protein